MDPLPGLNVRHHRAQLLWLLVGMNTRILHAASLHMSNLSMHAAHVPLLSSNRVQLKSLLDISAHEEPAAGVQRGLLAVMVIEDDKAV